VVFSGIPVSSTNKTELGLWVLNNTINNGSIHTMEASYIG
jgi:hypothetical protein